MNDDFGDQAPRRYHFLHWDDLAPTILIEQAASCDVAVTRHWFMARKDGWSPAEIVRRLSMYQFEEWAL